MKEKVCITTLEFPPDMGGVGESVDRIAHFLLDLGYEVHVAVFYSRYRTAADGLRRRAGCQTVQQDGIFVHRLQSAIRTAAPKMQDFLCDIYFQLKLLHRQYTFDLLHAFFLNETGYLTTLLAKENHLPVINSIRGSDLHKHIFSPELYAQMVWVLENSDWLTFVSPDLQDRAGLFVPGIQAKSSVFWNSIQPIDFDQLPTPTLISKLQGTVIGSAGSFRDKKGIEFLLDACATLSSELELTLLLVGDFAAKEREYWQQEVQRSGLGNRLLVTGIVNREEALAYLPHIDIVAIPSLHDGCPNAMLEAMLAGRAIVGTNVDAIAGILEDGIDALLVNPASTEELAIALRRLIVQPELREKLGSAARKKVLQQLAPSVEQDHWSEIYQRVLGMPMQVMTGNGKPHREDSHALQA